MSSSKAGGAGGFIGFAAFADPASTVAGAVAAAAATSGNASATNSSASSTGSSAGRGDVGVGGAAAAGRGGGPTPSPVFTGSDPHLHHLFRRIGQKRDATTRVRALAELGSYAFGRSAAKGGGAAAGAGDGGATAGGESATSTSTCSVSRPDKIAALSHLTYLALTKLLWDNHPSVRHGTISTLRAAATVIPKAWRGLVLYGAPLIVVREEEQMTALEAKPNTDAIRLLPDTGTLDTSGMTVASLIYVLQTDPGAEVAGAAREFVATLLGSAKGMGRGMEMGRGMGKDMDEHLLMKRTVQSSTINLALGVLRLGGADALDGAIFGGGRGNGNNGGGNSNKKGGRKNQQIQQQIQQQTYASEAEREEREERYERTVLAVLGGLSMLVQSSPEPSVVYADLIVPTPRPPPQGNRDDGTTSDHQQDEDNGRRRSSLWRHLTSSRSPFRRATYSMLSDLGQCAPSLLHGGRTTRPSGGGSSDAVSSSSPSNQLPMVLSNERDPGNVPTMLDFVLSFVASFRSTVVATATTATPTSTEDGSAGGVAAAVWDTKRGGINDAKLVSALSKMFRRGCHGSPAVGWSPTVLPLVACLPRSDGSHALQRKIVAALWEGKDSTGGGMNEAAVVTGVVETATFLLLRRVPEGGGGGGGNDDNIANNTASDDEGKDIAQYVFQGLEYYLKSPDNTRRDASSSSSSARDLCDALCRDLQRIDAADGRVGCILYSIREWFWAEEGVRRAILGSVSGENNTLAVTRLGNLLQVANASADENGTRSSGRLAPILRDSVSSDGANIAVPSTPPSEGSPNQAEIKLLLEVMRFCGVLFVLQGTSSVDNDAAASYISGTIVPWIISTFSSASAKTSPSLRAAYIEMFCLCLESTSSEDNRRQAWSSALSNMVSAHVDLSFLTDLIAKVQSPTSANGNVVRCDALDEFATQVGEAASLLFRESALSEQIVDTDESRSMCLLLQTFVGSTSKCSQMLVGQGVVHSWMASACPESDNNHLLLEDAGGNDLLLDVLLTMASMGDPCLSSTDVLQAMLQSFKEGGQLWESRALKLPESHPHYQQIMTNLEEGAKNMLKQDLGEIYRLHGRTDASRFCRIWSERCMRLFQFCPTPSLDLIGLSNIELWASSYSVSSPSLSPAIGEEADSCSLTNPLYACLRLVLQNFEPTKRRELLCGAMGDVDVSSTELVLHVLLSLANASSSQVPNTIVSRQQMCLDLFDILRELPRPYLLDLCKQTINLMAREMKDADNDGSSREVINRSVVVLDVLADKAFGRCHAAAPEGADTTPEATKNDDEVSQDGVKEGDKLYYVAKGEDGIVTSRLQCQVAKVHTEDYPNLYFTIRIEGEGGAVTERQTVANRLKKLPKAPPPTKLERKNKSGGSGGSDMTALLLDRVIKPYLPTEAGDNTSSRPSFVAEAAAECCSIAISRFGLGEKSGLGSVRYDVFQLVSGLERKARDSLAKAAGQVEEAATSLRCLALVLGFGSLSESSPVNVAFLKLSPADLVGAVHDAIDSATKTRQSSIATLMWLSVALSSPSTEGDVCRQAMFILDVISSKLFRQLGSENDLVLLLRAFSAVQKQAHGCIDYSSADSKSEKATLSALVRSFVATSVDEEDESPLWLDLFSSLLKYNLRRDGGDGRILLYGAKEWNEALCDTLFSPLKRRCGYQLLVNVASEQSEVNPSGQLSTETRRHLKKWKADLDLEEAQELQDDATGASKWLPECLMNVVEGWVEMSNEERAAEDEGEAMGKLLSWLVCLSFLDNAAAVDIRNRSSITSYLDKASAVGEILLTGTRYANLTDKNSTLWMSCLDAMSAEGDESATLSHVATLAVFRTIESVPTLAKKWYMDYCPRSIAPQINSFVEKRVAPETLQRELSRIGNVESTFGEMSVTGSCVSRVITATYVQDESTLSVQITVPPTFPLRNAEVDCKKTLGIPNQRWRRWELQITRMLNHEDGSILDALLLWKRNVDKEFEGVEPCPVCYSVLCVKSHTMPNLECKTCNNRFHSNCLMKWFKSSGKSQCVMCQQSWSGTKIT